MPGALPRLFRHSWGFAGATLGALASTMVLAAFVFRRIGSDAVHEAGFCAPPVPDGGDVYCALGVALAQIAGFLNYGAIVFGAVALFAAWNWWSTPEPGAASRDVGARNSGGGGGGGGGGGDGD